MAASSVRVSNVPCTAMYRATAPAAPATTSAMPARIASADVPLAPGPVAHPSLERVDPPLRLGLGQVDPERLDLGDALEVLADQRHLGLAVDVACVELVQQLCAVDRPEHQLPFSVQPLSSERVLGVVDVARVHGVGTS